MFPLQTMFNNASKKAAEMGIGEYGFIGRFENEGTASASTR